VVPSISHLGVRITKLALPVKQLRAGSVGAPSLTPAEGVVLSARRYVHGTDRTLRDPPLAASGRVWVVARHHGGLYVAATARTGGRLVYPLDDPYIHMAMAKNLSLHGVWG